jgi:hypothetical protein
MNLSQVYSRWQAPSPGASAAQEGSGEYGTSLQFYGFDQSLPKNPYEISGL